MPKWKEWKEIVNGEEVRFYRVRGKPEGREVQKIFRSDKHRAASKKADDLWNDWNDKERKRRGEDVPPPPANREKKVTFRQAADIYLDTRRALKREKASLHDYEKAIINHLEPWVIARGKGDSIKRIDLDDMNALVDDLIRGRFRSTKRGKEAGRPLGLVAQRKLLLLMKQILRKASVDGHITEVPGDKLKIEVPSPERTKVAEARQDKVFQFREIYTLLRAADRLQDHPDARRRQAWGPGGYRALTYLVSLTGLRISEAIAVKMRHVDLDEQVIKVRGGIDRYRNAGAPKNANAIRSVILHRGLIKVLRDYLVLAGMEDAEGYAFLFSTDAGRPMLPRTVHQRCWSVLVEEANRLANDPARTDKRLVPIDADGKAWHAARRFINSLMVHEKVDREALRQFMGHSGQDMTDYYTYRLDQPGKLDDLFRPEDLPPSKDQAA